MREKSLVPIVAAASALWLMSCSTTRPAVPTAEVFDSRAVVGESERDRKSVV